MRCIGFGILLVVLVIVVSSVCFGFTGGFIENVGQVDGVVRYYSHGSGMSVYFTDRGVVLDIHERVGGGVGGGVDGWSEIGIDRPDMLGEGALFERGHDPRVRGLEGREGLGERVRGCAVYIYFEGVSDDVEVVGRGELGTRYNYFIGSDPSGWHTGVRAYSEVVYRDVWGGVDLVYRMEGGNLEYEVVGEDLGLVRFRYEGVRRVFERDGFVEVEAGGWRLLEKRRGHAGVLGLVGEVATLASPETLANHSALLWSTFLGGSYHDEAFWGVLDASGNPVVTGCTYSPDFPTTPGAYDTTYDGRDDVFVAKLSSSGDSLLWSTLLGASARDLGWSIALDGSGNPVVIGFTGSSDFPITPRAYDTTFNGGWCDAFVAKLSSSGDSLLWSTFLGGSQGDRMNSLVLDGSDNPVVTGWTWSSDFPTTPGAYDTTFNGYKDVFIAKLSSSGDMLLWSTFLGGSEAQEGSSLVLDERGNPVVTGSAYSPDFPTTPGAYDTTLDGYGDVFVAKLSSSGDMLLWSTLLGGSGCDEFPSLVLDAGGNPVVTGVTSSEDFPTTPGAYATRFNGGLYDAFVAKLSSTGDSLLWSTFLGGSESDRGYSIVLDASGNPVVTGETGSSNFPTTPDAYDTTYNGGLYDAFIAKLSISGDSFLWGTFLGGSNDDRGISLVLDASGNALVVGSTESSDFPTTPGAYDRILDGGFDVFIAKLSQLPASVFPDGWQPGSDGDLAYASYPNPFMGRTSVCFSILQSEQVSIKIYDVKGELVRMLVDGSYDSGAHEVIWDGRGDDGVEVASGVYFIQIEAGGRKETQRIVLLR